jgi:uncharacterized membrane protein
VIRALKNVALSFMLFYWLFCLPLAFVIYLPFSYQVNCHWNERCDTLGEVQTQQAIRDLTGFLRHQSETLPSPPWSERENAHMREVRGMYTKVFGLFGIASLILLADMALRPGWRARYRGYARNNLFASLALLVLMLAIAPFFALFWRDVFHPLLFSNDLWLTFPSDVSWYLIPKAYFLRVILFIIGSTVLLHALVLRLIRP